MNNSYCWDGVLASDAATSTHDGPFIRFEDEDVEDYISEAGEILRVGDFKGGGSPPRREAIVRAEEPEAARA